MTSRGVASIGISGLEPPLCLPTERALARGVGQANRSTAMSNERLTSLALLHFHRDIDINIAEVIDEFARRFPRRLQLANILT